ncbi:hypothetical protein N7520_004826 [Penicillium odoratum]|uniref:uncharacterized protein n=1 Tax=Penicillium odoratum TaxID=1167516 RepID=UPI002548610F|nr:uncharacterized protein N7520_004826 [Penicillium odoratum]KAJ5765267.1 hypothetical protein N7520_004826 [Penicillium odoratum]
MANLPRLYLLSTATSSTTFLYQTRTLSQLYQRSPLVHQFHREYSTEQKDPGREVKAVGSSADPDLQDQNDSTKSTPTDPPRRTSYLRHRGAAVPRPKVKGTKPSAPRLKLNTITRNEREAFGGLLTRLNTAQKSPPLETHEPDSVPKTEDLLAVMSIFESILEDKSAAAKESRAAKFQDGTLSDKGPSRKSDQPEETVYEAEDVRIGDLGLEVSSAGTNADSVVTLTEAVNMIVEREAKRIESELFQAVEQGKGDAGLWAVCRERIFTMISHIGGPISANDQNLDPDSVNAAHSSGPLNIPAAVPAGPVVAKLYPQLLLLAFRILSTHFPQSPLISQFRTAAKAHGSSSAFLGTSQTLCDELMDFYWYSCNDLPAVVSFLRDMDTAGLDPSRRVRKLLRDIVQQHDRDVKSTRKAGGEHFWDAPPNQKAFHELAGSGGWIETINSRKLQRRRTAIPVPRM